MTEHVGEITAKGLGYIAASMGMVLEDIPFRTDQWSPDARMWIRGFSLGQRDSIRRAGLG